MPTTPKLLNQSTRNKKVTPNILFILNQKHFLNFKKVGEKSLHPLKTQKMPITPKALNQLIQNVAHMFGGIYDHQLFGQWAEVPPKPSAGDRMKGA